MKRACLIFQTLMLYKLYSQGFVRSLDDPVTYYQFDFSVKNPFNNAPITLRWVLHLYSFLPGIIFPSNNPRRNLSKALKVSKVIVLIEQFSYDLEKYSVSKCSLFVMSANGWKDPNLASLFSIPAKENCNMEKALFDWPIVLQYEVKAEYRLNSRKFLGMKFLSPERSLNQPKATLVCIRSINQSNRSISVR